MVMIVGLITGVGILLLIIGTAFLRPNLALLPSEEYDSGKDVSGGTIYFVCHLQGENIIKAKHSHISFSFIALLGNGLRVCVCNNRKNITNAPKITSECAYFYKLKEVGC